MTTTATPSDLVGSVLVVRLVRHDENILQPFYPTAVTTHRNAREARREADNRQRLHLADSEMLLLVEVRDHAPAPSVPPKIRHPLHVAPKTDVAHGAEVALCIEGGAVRAIAVFPAGRPGAAHRWASQEPGEALLGTLLEVYGFEGVVHSTAAGTGTWSRAKVPVPNGRMTTLLVWGPEVHDPMPCTADPERGRWIGREFEIKGGHTLAGDDRWMLVAFPYTRTTPEFVVYDSDDFAVVRGDVDAILATEFGELVDHSELAALAVGANAEVGEYGNVRRLR